MTIGGAAGIAVGSRVGHTTEITAPIPVSLKACMCPLATLERITLEVLLLEALPKNEMKREKVVLLGSQECFGAPSNTSDCRLGCLW